MAKQPAPAAPATATSELVHESSFEYSGGLMPKTLQDIAEAIGTVAQAEWAGGSCDPVVPSQVVLRHEAYFLVRGGVSLAE